MISIYRIERRIVGWFLIFAILLTSIVLGFRYWKANSVELEWETQRLQSIHAMVKDLMDIEAESLKAALDNARFFISVTNSDIHQQVTSNIFNQNNGTSIMGRSSALIEMHRDGEISALFSDISETEISVLQSLFSQHMNTFTTVMNQSGLAFAEGNLYWFAATENVPQSENSQPGQLIIVKETSSAIFNKLAQESGVLVQLEALLDKGEPKIFFDGHLYNSLLSQVNVNSHSVSGQFDLWAEGQQLPLAISITKTREAQQMMAPFVATLPVVLGTVTVAVLMFVLLRWLLITPLMKCDQYLRTMLTENKGFSEIENSRDDELGGLFNTVNQLLSSLYLQSDFSKTLLDSIGEIIVTVDQQNKVKYLNPAAKAWLKAENDYERLLGKSIDLLLVGCDEKANFIAALLEKIKRSGAQVDTHGNIHTATCPDTSINMQVTGYPMISQDGHKDGAILLISKK